MYKVTLFDNATPGFCSRVVSYYVDDIEEFQRRWFSLEKSEDKKERFLRSLQGEMVSDFYTNEPELNIVQKDANSKVYEEQTINKEDCYVIAVNGYGCKTKFHVEDMKINIRWIQFQDKYLKIAMFSTKGMTALRFENEYYQVLCYGNRVLEKNFVSTVYCSDSPKEFAEDTVSSIASAVINTFTTEEDLVKDIAYATITDKEMERLLKDIVGEAG